MFLPERQGHNLTLTVVCLPRSLGSGPSDLLETSSTKQPAELARCRANMALTRQARPEFGGDFM